jgi:hypothetical protein
MKNILIILLCLTVGGAKVQAQKRNKYKYKKSKSQHFSKRMVDPLYSYSQSPYRPLGIHFSLGATYTFTDLNPDEYTTSMSPDTSFTYKHDPYGRIGYYFDIGMVHIFKKPNKIIQYWDWALGIKHFAGAEEFKSSMNDAAGNQTGSAYGKGKWDNGYVFARINIHNVIPIGKWNFIDNSFGINADYNIYGAEHNNQWEGTNIPTDQHFQQKFIASLHYRFGFGIKLKEGMFLVPFAEIPIFTGYEWNKGKPVIRWFDSWYLPITVGVKFALLFKKDANACPPVYNSDGDQDKSNQFQQQK